VQEISSLKIVEQDTKTKDKHNMKNTTQKGTVYSYARWSSEQQTLGDSERRQISQAQRFAEQHGLKLSNETFEDRGVSAWKGDHRETGRLGALLAKVSEGDAITIDCYSRWSREHPLDGLNALRETTDKGVTVHFTSAGLSISRDNFRSMFAMLSMHAQLSNAETEEKSRNIRSAYQGRREEMQKGKIGFGRLPAWLKWSAPADQPERKPLIDEAKANIVRKIFALSAEGKGVRQIERDMRAKNIKPISNSKKADWNARFVHRLIGDRGVLGYHPGSEVAVYPAIVDQDLFESANRQLKNRQTSTVRHSVENNSLFTKLAYCSACGSPMGKQTTNTSKGRKYAYLVCTGSVRQKTNCPCTGLPYDAFEKSFAFMLSHSIKVREYLADDSSGPSQVDILRGRLEGVHKRFNKISAMIEGDDNPSRTLNDQLKELETEEDKLNQQIEAESARQKTPALKSYGELAALDMSNQEHRSKIRVLLRDVVTRITVEVAEKRYTVRFTSGRLASSGPAGTWMMQP
jgi:DNA invertase Pin-like site-specific DNA recombinase